MSKKILLEQKLDSQIRKIVRDIISLFKKEDFGDFELPSDLKTNEMTYSIPKLGEISVYVSIIPNNRVEGYKIDSEFYPDDNTINVEIIYNPSYGPKIMYELVADLNDNLAHELTHLSQLERGYKFPKKEPPSSLEYYTQPHELEAQMKGFKRIAKIQKKPLIDVIEKWFDDNRERHGLNDDEIKKVINTMLFSED